MSPFTRIFLLELLLLGGINAYKYLVFSPNFGQSHTRFMGKYADVLAEGGHDVTILMPTLRNDTSDFTGSKLVEKIIRIGTGEKVAELWDQTAGYLSSIWTHEDSLSSLFHHSTFSDMFGYGCKEVLSNTALLDQLKAEKFDVAFAEPFCFCGFGIFELLGINRTIATLSAVTNEGFTQYTGQPRIPSYIPSLYSEFGQDMNIYERAINTIITVFGTKFYDDNYAAEHAVFVEKFGSFKSIQEIFGQVSLHFDNSHPYLNYPQPKLPKSIDIGGFAVDLSPEAIGKLDEQWNHVLSERPKTVLVSFGTVCRSKDLPLEWKNSLIEVFESMPNVTFIWKYEDPTTIVDHLPNVHVSSWVPQNALLADSRLSLFITHGGLASTMEIAHLGVPSIMVPVFADQLRNAAMMCRLGGAACLNKFNLGDRKLLQSTIEKVLVNQSYVENARRISEMLKVKHGDVKKSILVNSEIVARFGPLNSLTPRGQDLNVIQYHLLDLYAIFVVVLLIVVYLLKYVALRIYRVFCWFQKSKKE